MTISKSHPDTLRTLTSDAHDPNRTADRHDPYITDLETSLNNGYIRGCQSWMINYLTSNFLFCKISLILQSQL